MAVQLSGPRGPGRDRAWGLIGVLAGFAAAALCVIGIGVLSLELGP